MGNKKNNLTAVSTDTIAAPVVIENVIEIRGANLKDNFCNYTYALKSGPTAGDSLKRSGASIIHIDMKKAFSKLKPHLAVICEEIEHSKIGDVSEYEAIASEKEELEHDRNDIPDFDERYAAFEKRLTAKEKKVLQFFVTGISLDGTGENESVTLIGIKRLSTGEDLQLKTPRIKWEGAYQFIDELRAIVDEVKNEVSAYMNGKAAPKVVQTELFEKAEEITNSLEAE